MDMVFRPLLVNYNAKYIPSIAEFMTAVDWLLVCASNDNKVQQKLENPNDDLSEAKTRASVAEANVKLLNGVLPKQSQDLTRLTTELAAVNALIAELERDAKRSESNLIRARSASQEGNTEVYDLEGKLTNLTRHVYDVVRTAVAPERLCVDRIHNPSDGSPQPYPKGASKTWSS